jgi:hypothetical protein
MNKRLLASTVITSLALFLFTSISYSNKNFAPVGNTNAPGENTCAKSGCHATFPVQGNMPARITITADGIEIDANFKYAKGTTYNMNFLINNAKARNGFSLTMLNSNGELVGTLATSSNDAQISNGVAGKKYVGHTNSLGVSSWDFQWTAPLDSQVVTVYSIANLANNNNATSGDSILTKSFSFTALADTTADTTGTAILSRTLTENIQVINAIENGGVAFNIDVNEVKYFNCEIMDLNGAIVFRKEYLLHTGQHHIAIPVLNNKGLYFLRISSGANSSTYKFIN